ncbi:NAD(P)H-dependent oxidoreductase subunit E [Dysgonomonas sp. 511]|uniref:NADH-quinone oxidoreductase subunit NuoE family protein n=1 Tax=Dysgonomonas sp. 511 TaxID=2302930 RepID=UPI0013D6FCEC|nr:NAD(P)H-dependent oxidoreductase subunit E [Dysgonomonas sp. 511]NDV77806.1 NAD(P)H-dependent oxidoreductase subunit E [Dysgonomonas sp. 511]
MREYKQIINLSDALMARINELLSRYPVDKKKSAMLPVLHAVQDAHDNWLSLELMDKVAEILEVKPIEVYEVATFYSMLNTKPVAKYMFEFCRTSCCALRKGEELMEYTCRKLGVKEGETTPDGMFSVVGVECLGACGYGPMLQLGDNYHEHLTKEKIDALIEDCKQGKVSMI